MLASPLGRHRAPTLNLARLVAWGCLALALLPPAYITFLWVRLAPEVLVANRMTPIDASILAPGGVLPGWKRLVGGLGGLIPALIMSWGWLRARTALLAIADDRVFAPEVMRGLRGYAAACFWWAVAGVLKYPVMSLLLSIGNPPGRKALSFGISDGYIFSIIGAGVLWVIAAALARGAAAAEENRQFV